MNLVIHFGARYDERSLCGDDLGERSIFWRTVTCSRCADVRRRNEEIAAYRFSNALCVEVLTRNALSRGRMWIAALVVAALTACTSDESPACDPADTCAPAPVLSCNDWRALVEPSDFAEVAIAGDVTVLDVQDFYVCPWDMPPVSDVTWTASVRRTDNGQDGAIIVTSTGQQLTCEWRPAIAFRETYVGSCDPSQGAK